MDPSLPPNHPRNRAFAQAAAEGAPAAPAGLDLPSAKLVRAQLAATIPSQENYDALKVAQVEAQDAQRTAQLERLASLDEQIAQAEEAAAAAPDEV